jgi:Ca-activated chloride channel homolog
MRRGASPRDSAPQDQMSVLQFATDVTRADAFTNKLPQIDHGLGQFAAIGRRRSTTRSAWVRRAGQAKGRKVLVLVSDGDDTAKSSTYAQALERRCATR